MGLQKDIDEIKEVLSKINTRLSRIEGELYQAKIRESANMMLNLKAHGFAANENPPPEPKDIV